MLHQLLEQRLRAAVTRVVSDADPANILVRPAADPQFGDYQSNALMGIAKERRLNPRQLAADVVTQLDVADLCAAVAVAGPGFLNFRLQPSALADVL